MGKYAIKNYEILDDGDGRGEIEFLGINYTINYDNNRFYSDEWRTPKFDFKFENVQPEEFADFVLENEDAFYEKVENNEWHEIQTLDGIGDFEKFKEVFGNMAKEYEEEKRKDFEQQWELTNSYTKACENGKTCEINEYRGTGEHSHYKNSSIKFATGEEYWVHPFVRNDYPKDRQEFLCIEVANNVQFHDIPNNPYTIDEIAEELSRDDGTFYRGLCNNEYEYSQVNCEGYYPLCFSDAYWNVTGNSYWAEMDNTPEREETTAKWKYESLLWEDIKNKINNGYEESHTSLDLIDDRFKDLGYSFGLSDFPENIQEEILDHAASYWQRELVFENKKETIRYTEPRYEELEEENTKTYSKAPDENIKEDKELVFENKSYEEPRLTVYEKLEKEEQRARELEQEKTQEKTYDNEKVYER